MFETGLKISQGYKQEYLAKEVVDEDREDGQRTDVTEEEDDDPTQNTGSGTQLVIHGRTVYYPAYKYGDQHSSERQEYVAWHIIEHIENRHTEYLHRGQRAE